MASRRSGRRGAGGRGFLMMGGAVFLAGACLGGYFLMGSPNAATADASIAGALPGPAGEQGAPGTAAPVVSISQIDRALAEVQGSIAASEGDAREKSLRDGYARLVSLLEGPLPVTERERVIQAFHPVTDELFLSSVHNEFSVNYVARSGDSYEKIARGAGVSLNLLTDLNNLPRGAKNLQVGQNLKLPKAPPRIVVRKTEYCASVYFGNWMVRQYVVAHGKNNNTPVGKTTIKDMGIDPEKSARGPNDPVAEMKLRWIGLNKYNDRTGFGFHGTQYPESIPGQTSKGCIRMRDEDVVELYDIVRPGNEVEIRA